MSNALDAAIAQESARKTARAVAEELIPPEVGRQLPPVVEQRLPAEVAAYIREHPPRDGRDGAKGIDGTDGEPGLVWKGPWKRRSYERGDAVERKGSSYIATAPTREEPPGAPWDLLAAKGEDGKSGGVFIGAGSGAPGGGAVDSVNGQTGVVVVDAGDIPFTPAGTISATNVQAAIEEVAAEAGSGAFDYVQVANPGAVGAGKTWLRLGPLIEPDMWEASTDYVEDQRVQPTTPNGHYYVAQAAGTSDISEPTFPTDGSNVVDGSVDWDDRGLITAVSLETLSAFIRSDADDEWLKYSLGDAVDESVLFISFRPDGTRAAQVEIAPDSAVLTARDAGGHYVALFAVYADQIEVLGPKVHWNLTGVEFHSLAGSADPSAGGGVTGGIGSQYTRVNGGVGELWLKTGAGDTDWEQSGGSGTPAADPGDIADPTSATAEDVALKVNALMAAMRIAASLA